MNYVLDDEGKPKAEKDIITWAKWMQSNDRYLRKTDTPDGFLVSTIFLGIDHQFGEGPPLLFETIVFGLPHGEQYQQRYSTKEEASEGHEKAVRWIRVNKEHTP